MTEPAATIGTRVARNAAAAFGGQTAIALMGLAATAIMVRFLGTARFGAWSLISALVAYAGLMDLGIGVALVRRVAEADSNGERRAAGEAVGAALVVTTIMGFITALLLWLIAVPAAGWLRVPAPIVPEFVTALRICGVAAGLALPGTAFGAVPSALQRLGRLVRLEVGITALVLAGQGALLLLGGTMVSLAWLFLAGRVASLAGRWIMARRMLEGAPLVFRARYPFWSSLGRFGTLKVIHQLMSQIVLYLDRLLVGALVSVEAVAYYTVALELAQRLLMVQSNVSQAFYPAACALASDRDAFGRLFVQATRAVALFTFPVAAVLAVLAEPLLAVWVGPEFARAAPVLRVVAIAYAVMALTAIPAAAADAMNEPGLSVRYGLVSVALNISMALLLIPRLGAIGAAWAIAINVVVPTPFFIRTVTSRLAGVDLSLFVRRAVIEPVLPAIALALLLFFGWHAFSPARAARMPLTLAAGFAAFVLAVRRLVRIDADERLFLAGMPGGQMLGRLLRRA